MDLNTKILDLTDSKFRIINHIVVNRYENMNMESDDEEQDQEKHKVINLFSNLEILSNEYV